MISLNILELILEELKEDLARTDTAIKRAKKLLSKEKEMREKRTNMENHFPSRHFGEDHPQKEIAL